MRIWNIKFRTWLQRHQFQRKAHDSDWYSRSRKTVILLFVIFSLLITYKVYLIISSDSEVNALKATAQDFVIDFHKGHWDTILISYRAEWEGMQKRKISAEPASLKDRRQVLLILPSQDTLEILPEKNTAEFSKQMDFSHLRFNASSASVRYLDKNKRWKKINDEMTLEQGKIFRFSDTIIRIQQSKLVPHSIEFAVWERLTADDVHQKTASPVPVAPETKQDKLLGVVTAGVLPERYPDLESKALYDKLLASGVILYDSRGFLHKKETLNEEEKKQAALLTHIGRVGLKRAIQRFNQQLDPFIFEITPKLGDDQKKILHLLTTGWQQSFHNNGDIYWVPIAAQQTASGIRLKPIRPIAPEFQTDPFHIELRWQPAEKFAHDVELSFMISNPMDELMLNAQEMPATIAASILQGAIIQITHKTPLGTMQRNFGIMPDIHGLAANSITWGVRNTAIKPTKKNPFKFSPITINSHDGLWWFDSDPALNFISGDEIAVFKATFEQRRKQKLTLSLQGSGIADIWTDYKIIKSGSRLPLTVDLPVYKGRFKVKKTHLFIRVRASFKQQLIDDQRLPFTIEQGKITGFRASSTDYRNNYGKLSSSAPGSITFVDRNNKPLKEGSLPKETTKAFAKALSWLAAERAGAPRAEPLTAMLTLDANIQDACQKAVNESVVKLKEKDNKSLERLIRKRSVSSVQTMLTRFNDRDALQRKQHSASVLLINEDGEILCAASKTIGFGAIESKNLAWGEPHIPPGSTFKVPVALAAMKLRNQLGSSTVEGKQLNNMLKYGSERISGHTSLQDIPFGTHNKVLPDTLKNFNNHGGHSQPHNGISMAIMKSQNIYFGYLGMMLDSNLTREQPFTHQKRYWYRGVAIPGERTREWGLLGMAEAIGANKSVNLLGNIVLPDIFGKLDQPIDLTDTTFSNQIAPMPARLPHYLVRPAEVVGASIGERDVRSTPLFGAMSALVARSGKSIQPRLFSKLTGSDGHVIMAGTSLNREQLIAANELGMIHYGMGMAVNRPGGTSYYRLGSKIRKDDFRVFGKTGSASSGKKDYSHAWFIGWAEPGRFSKGKYKRISKKESIWVKRDKSEYSTNLSNKAIGFAVLVPESGNGGPIAAPIARDVLKSVMPKLMNRKAG